MRKIFAIAVLSLLMYPSHQTEAQEMRHYLDDLIPSVLNARQTLTTTDFAIMQIKEMLLKYKMNLSEGAINKALTVLACAANHDIDQNTLTIIDYSLPSSEKRLWIFDLQHKKLLFHTYVSHGIKSGVLLSNYFSNKYNSKASSIGVYKTISPYYGRHGLSLRLDGLEFGFNDHADGRAIVMHGGWYVTERFIKKYGRAGRSWGCPAVPSELNQSIIDTIKDNALFIAYYPDDKWQVKSKFLNCPYFHVGSKQNIKLPLISEVEQRDDILFAKMDGNHHMTDSTPVLVIDADKYEQVFHEKAPLTRMLRRQIHDKEYIALNQREFQYLANTHESNQLYLVKTNIKMVRGYFATEMSLIGLDNITEIQANPSDQSYTIHFAAKPAVEIKPSSEFVRWIGL